MDYKVILVAPLIAIAGFIFLGKVLESAWNSFSDREGGSHQGLSKKLNPKHPLPHNECYDECISEADWNCTSIPTCVAACGA